MRGPVEAGRLAQLGAGQAQGQVESIGQRAGRLGGRLGQQALDQVAIKTAAGKFSAEQGRARRLLGQRLADQGAAQLLVVDQAQVAQALDDRRHQVGADAAPRQALGQFGAAQNPAAEDGAGGIDGAVARRRLRQPGRLLGVEFLAYHQLQFLDHAPGQRHQRPAADLDHHPLRLAGRGLKGGDLRGGHRHYLSVGCVQRGSARITNRG